MNKANPKIDFFFEKESKWQKEYCVMRSIALDCKLSEDLKWGVPCYTIDNKNVVLIHGFKDYCAFLFFKGALLKDENSILIQQSENVQSQRQIRFTNATQISEKADIIKKYILEATEIEKLGKKVNYKKTDEYEIPDEFNKKLEELPNLKNAFYSLTPGRQRAYIFHFSQAKQSKTREARVEKYIDKILDGKGLDD